MWYPLDQISIPIVLNNANYLFFIKIKSQNTIRPNKKPNKFHQLRIKTVSFLSNVPVNKILLFNIGVFNSYRNV